MFAQKFGLPTPNISVAYRIFRHTLLMFLQCCLIFPDIDLLEPIYALNNEEHVVWGDQRTSLT